ncbi:MAG: aldo/keto reductase [Lentisphaeria bacterium]|nr:aldo/keto reductase [Lentisphaeria bacterium]
MKFSSLILGTVQFGLNYGISNTHGQTGFPEVCRILKTAYDNGITTLDTAAGYGESESVLGRALQETGLADKMNIVSKVLPLPDGLTEEQAEKLIRDSLTNSLKNLRCDFLHTLLFHREKDWKFAGILKKCKQEGLIRHFGCSVDGEIPPNSEMLEAIQIPGNLLDKRFFPFLKQARKQGCHVYIRSVYLQGLLLMPEEKIPASLQALVPYRRKLSALAEKNGMSLAELCVRYLCSIPEIDGVLTGVETAEQLKINLSLAEKGALPEDILLAAEQMIPELPEELIRPSLWKKQEK